MATDAEINAITLDGAAGVLSPVSAQSRTVTVVHQHIGPQRDHGRIHRYCSIRRGPGAAGGDAIGRVIRGLTAAPLTGAVICHAHTVQHAVI